MITGVEIHFVMQTTEGYIARVGRVHYHSSLPRNRISQCKHVVAALLAAAEEDYAINQRTPQHPELAQSKDVQRQKGEPHD